MTAEELRDVLGKHAKWSMGEEGGERADLRRANLYEANLRGANLRGADLSWANLRRADLRRADLRRADLRRADLSWADLSWADLRRANLRGANLRGADLCEANLRGANLRGANLRGANLRGANLRGANLSGANLRGAYLCEANLCEANLREARNIPDELAARLLMCPESGAFDGWKKCREGVLVRVRIPAEARRSSATTRKCRAEFVDVLEVIGAEVGISEHDNKTEYRAGQRVTCHEWCEDRWIECAGGIHFFLTRAEAGAYQPTKGAHQ